MANENVQYTRLLCMLLLCVVVALFIVYSYQPLKPSLPLLVNTNQQKYVFFDLGVNNGDSLLNFLGLKSNG